MEDDDVGRALAKSFCDDVTSADDDSIQASLEEHLEGQNHVGSIEKRYPKLLVLQSPKPVSGYLSRLLRILDRLSSDVFL